MVASRKAAAMFGIFLYCIAISYPFILNCSYTLNKTYISGNLCINRFKENSTCNGKCYLMKQMDHQQQDHSAAKSTIPATTTIYEVTAHIVWDTSDALTPAASLMLIPMVKEGSAIAQFIEVPSPPPQEV